MEEKTLDEVFGVALVNFYTLGKKDKQIKLINFDEEKEEHRALFVAALTASRRFHYKIFVKAGLFKFLKLKRQYRHFTKIYRLKKGNWDAPTCDEFIENITQHEKYSGAFRELYFSYFKELI